MSRGPWLLLVVSLGVFLVFTGLTDDSRWRLAAWPRSESAALGSWLQSKADRYRGLPKEFGATRGDGIALQGLGYYVMGSLGWPADMAFAKFGEAAVEGASGPGFGRTFVWYVDELRDTCKRSERRAPVCADAGLTAQEALASVPTDKRAFLLVVPGNGTLQR